MKQLNEKLVAIIAAVLKGANLKKFLESVQILNDSLAQEGWIPRGSVKADSGFYQGISKAFASVETCSAEWYAANDVEQLLNYGVCRIKTELKDSISGKPKKLKYPSTELGVLRLGIKTLREHPAGRSSKFNLSDEVIMAWYRLVKEKEAAKILLNEARPLPKITPVGLSPKVTTTLKECNLDLDLPSIKMAKIAFRFVQAKKYDEKKKEWLPVILKDGSYLLDKEYYVKWTEGIAHNRSRFASGCHCHACGKAIPSGRFVPVEAFDKKKSVFISMWLGCDCASNIFGIKDIGIKQGE